MENILIYVKLNIRLVFIFSKCYEGLNDLEYFIYKYTLLICFTLDFYIYWLVNLLELVSVAGWCIAELVEGDISQLDVDHSARWEGGVVQVGSEQDTGHQEDQSLHQLAVDSEPLANFLLAMTNAARQRRKTHFGSLVGGPWKITSLEETQLATKAAGS